MNKVLLETLEKHNISYRLGEPMSEHTSFKIGGKADIFITVDSAEKLILAVKALKEAKMPCFTVGKGSNLLVSDEGIEGAVLSLSGMDDIKADGNKITAYAGASLAAVCIYAMNKGLSGLEFAFGIPASVGGALYMNAGAYGGELSQRVISAEYLDGDGNVKTISVADMALGYRTSVFKHSDMIIISATFSLEEDKKEDIKARMDDYMSRRREKQPLEYPSAGSTFKRPVGHFAGALIEKNGLKGFSVGSAAVSEKHAGFVINLGSATCKDVKAVMAAVVQRVYENDGVTLEPEVIFVGRE